MLSNTVQTALNDQIKHELYSGYLYLSMAAHFESANLPGFAVWMKKQGHEEAGHAMKIYEYIHDQGGRVTLQALDGPPTQFGSPLSVFQAVPRTRAEGNGPDPGPGRTGKQRERLCDAELSAMVHQRAGRGGTHRKPDRGTAQDDRRLWAVALHDERPTGCACVSWAKPGTVQARLSRSTRRRAFGLLSGRTFLPGVAKRITMWKARARPARARATDLLGESKTAMSNREPIPPVAIPGGDPAAPARFPAQDSRLLTMFEIAKILATEHDQGMMLQRFLATLIQTLPAADAGFLVLYDPHDELLKLKAAQGYDSAQLARMRLAPGESMTGLAFQTGQSGLYATPEAVAEGMRSLKPANRDAFTAATVGLGRPQSAACIPLITDDKKAGVLVLENLRQTGSFTQADVTFLQHVADLITLSIENATLKEQLRIDPGP